MKALLSEIRGAVLATLVLATVCCGVYPLFVYAVGQIAFHDRANGSLIVDSKGTVHGSRLLGQSFSGEEYFSSRPSAAGTGYDATSSGGSNLGPTSQKLNDAIKERIEAYRRVNNLKDSDLVPADAVTSSGSGLDPHISLRNAELQTPRVARARGMSVQAVNQFLRQNIDARDFGFLGEAGVNVLALNLALDKTQPVK